MAAVYRFTFLGSFVGQDCQNTFHVKTDDPLTIAERAQLAIDIAAAAQTHVEGDSRWSDQYSLSQVSSQRVDLAAQLLLNHIVDPFVGFSGGATLSPATTISVQWRTFTDRPNRGRSSVGGFSVLASDTDGTPHSNALATVAGWADDIMDAINAGPQGATMVVARYTGTPGVVTLSNPVVDSVISDKFGTMRSRITGRGS